MWSIIKLLSIATLAICAPSKRNLAFDYQNSKIRGVNLGGWFVLEPYITPSLFDAFDDVPVDEFHYCQQLGYDECFKRLSHHWDTWYSEGDFKQMADAGLNSVRIPIGYWAFKPYDYDPYVTGQVPYLDRALEWCRKYGLTAWIDLHGAPGGQNGFDNSGLRDIVDFTSNQYNVALATDVIKIIAEKYGGDEFLDVVIGIELLNEPLGSALDMDALKDFFLKGYDIIRGDGRIQAVVFHDAFEQPSYWQDFMNTQDNNYYWNVVADHHHYQIFSAGELQRSMDDHIDFACQQGREHLEEPHWNIIGEWSAALTDCARWLNGVGRGARWSGDYDNSPFIQSCDKYISYDQFPDFHKVNMRKWIEVQLDAYDTRQGWYFWNWKCEHAIEWDMKELIATGLFPQPLDDRQYNNQCGY